MASLLHRFGRGRVIAAAVVEVTAGLLLALTRMVFSPPRRVREGTGNRPNGEPTGHVVPLLDHGNAEPEGRRCRQYS